MNYTEKLEKRIISCGNPICMGMDPVLGKIPLDGEPEYIIREFYMNLLKEMDKRKIFPAVVKPNSAYYEMISPECMAVLQELIVEYQKRGIMVILDAKRGDIGKSSSAYAYAGFDVYNSDCITVSPYMGADSVKPFLNIREDLGVYALLRTSNKGAEDIQDIICEDGKPLFYKVATKLLEWNNGSMGAVVGATNPEELTNIMAWFIEQGQEIPFLIPGVGIAGVPGQQGGDVKTVIKALKAGGSKRNIHVLNSSSGLNYAWQVNNKPEKYASACVDALEMLAEQSAKF